MHINRIFCCSLYWGKKREKFKQPQYLSRVLYAQHSGESYNRASFVVCDVSTDRNEHCLRGGVHVSPSLSNAKEPCTGEL